MDSHNKYTVAETSLRYRKLRWVILSSASGVHRAERGAVARECICRLWIGFNGTTS